MEGKGVYPPLNPDPPSYNPQAPGYNPQAPGYNPQGPGYGQPPQPGYPQPQPGYGPGAAYQPQPTTVVIQQPVAVGGGVPEHPYTTICPHCNAQVVTQVEYKAGALAWLVCFGLAIFGLICGCCLIPFCVNGMKDAVHTCPQCKALVGKYSRL